MPTLRLLSSCPDTISITSFSHARQDVEPLSKAFRPSLGWERRGASDYTELESWTSSPGGGLVVAVKQTIASLVQ
jgi:mediator of RNA polymerase II transcription subunit 5